MDAWAPRLPPGQPNELWVKFTRSMFWCKLNLSREFMIHGDRLNTDDTVRVRTCYQCTVSEGMVYLMLILLCCVPVIVAFTLVVILSFSPHGKKIRSCVYIRSVLLHLNRYLRNRYMQMS